MRVPVINYKESQMESLQERFNKFVQNMIENTNEFEGDKLTIRKKRREKFKEDLLRTKEFTEDEIFNISEEDLKNAENNSSLL